MLKLHGFHSLKSDLKGQKHSQRCATCTRQVSVHETGSPRAKRGTFHRRDGTLRCVSLRKVERMLSVSILWCVCDEVGGRTEQEGALMWSIAAALCECQDRRESRSISVCGCVGVSV